VTVLARTAAKHPAQTSLPRNGPQPDRGLLAARAGTGCPKETNRAKMGGRWGWTAMVSLIAMAAGCQTTTIQGPGRARMLTGFEMDAVTAGSAVAVNDATARALGSTPQTAILGIASAYSGSSPIAGAPLLNYANSQATASASNGELAQAGLSSRVSVDSSNGGASIDAQAAGTGTSRAQVTAQFYGISTNRSDLVFGSISAAACCGSVATAQVKVDGEAGGPYTRELQAAPVSDSSGQVQRRVDIAVVSSALPILDPAQLLVTGGSARVSPKY
jgi:hypothetical protein